MAVLGVWTQSPGSRRGSGRLDCRGKAFVAVLGVWTQSHVALGDLTVEAKPLWRFWVSGPKVKVADVALGDLTVEAKPFVAVLGVWGL